MIGGPKESGGTCDLCGDEYEGWLPDHLVECDGSKPPETHAE